MPLYFAFGSNMSSSRLVERVGEVEVVGRARLPGRLHAFDKLGSDGSGKGNVAALDPASHVWGVVYGLDRAQFDALDVFEGGYGRRVVRVVNGDEALEAITYIADHRHTGLRPTPDYLDHYLRGMAEHGIPDEYTRFIRRLAARPS